MSPVRVRPAPPPREDPGTIQTGRRRRERRSLSFCVIWTFGRVARCRKLRHASGTNDQSHTHKGCRGIRRVLSSFSPGQNENLHQLRVMHSPAKDRARGSSNIKIQLHTHFYFYLSQQGNPSKPGFPVTTPRRFAAARFDSGRGGNPNRLRKV